MSIARQGGFSLLEVLMALSLAMASLIFVQQLWQSYWHRNQWWQTLAQASAGQREVIDSLASLHANRCANGLTLAGQQSWQLALDLGRGCELFDLRFKPDKQQLQRRREGGRYSAFLHGVRNVQLVYGLANDQTCEPERWLTSVTQELAPRVVLMQIQLQLHVVSGVKPLALPQGWELDMSDNQWSLWVAVNTLLPLGCHHE